jgi:hypothetical protein
MVRAIAQDRHNAVDDILALHCSFCLDLDVSLIDKRIVNGQGI